MKKIFYIVAMLFCMPVQAEIVAYFSPKDGGCQVPIIEHLNNATETIDIAVYAITSRDITTAIKSAHDRGVKIRILSDRTQAEYRLSTVRKLHDYGIDVRVNSKHRLQHNKYAIFDNKTLITGSFNWTYSAGHKNSENCLVITNEPTLITQFNTDFTHLWQINTQSESDKWFSGK